MWENTSSGPSLYHTRRGIGNYLFHIFLTRIVVSLEDGERLVASDCHNPFVVPAFSDLASNERMTDVVEMETFDLCFAAGRLKRPLPSFIALPPHVKTWPPIGATFPSRCSLRISSRISRRTEERGMARFSFVLVS